MGQLPKENILKLRGAKRALERSAELRFEDVLLQRKSPQGTGLTAPRIPRDRLE
jgi:hypothetical protein